MLLETTDVKSGYGDILIVNGVDLSVSEGEIVSIIGPNGAGKSTFLKTVVGILDVRSGTVEFKGEDISNIGPDQITEHDINYVPQNKNIFPNLTVEENLKMGAWSINRDYFSEKVEEMFNLFPVLEERFGQKVGTMSGGQQQMVAFATALMTDPELLILDEPSAGLAPQLVDDIFDKIVEINENGTAILMVEQNARQALQESDRGVLLAEGEDRMEGTGEELLEDEDVAELYLGA